MIGPLFERRRAWKFKAGRGCGNGTRFSRNFLAFATAHALVLLPSAGIPRADFSTQFRADILHVLAFGQARISLGIYEQTQLVIARRLFSESSQSLGLGVMLLAHFICTLVRAMGARVPGRMLKETGTTTARTTDRIASTRLTLSVQAVKGEVE